MAVIIQGNAGTENGVDAVNVVNVSVAIVIPLVDALVKTHRVGSAFTRIDPHVRCQVLVRKTHAGVDGGSAEEPVFLVGGNGGGKSTLAKIITGLYPPETGEIRLNGKPITDQNRDDYRQLFSAVFSDFYLFESFLGLNASNLDVQAQDYLVQLHLHRKVKVRQGVLSTTDLSHGQRKRLALLTAYLEDRPFYLFDEWASDQDPHFKEIFYTQLLPELKARGKTALVITHDDRFLHVADRIIKFDYGKLVYEKRMEARVLEPVLQA